MTNQNIKETIEELRSSRTYLGTLAIRSDELDRKSIKYITGIIKKAIDILDSKPNIIKCSECEFGKEIISSHNGIYQTMYECTSKETFPTTACVIHTKDWFCADGEKRNVK